MKTVKKIMTTTALVALSVVNGHRVPRSRGGHSAPRAETYPRHQCTRTGAAVSARPHARREAGDGLLQQ